MDPVLRSIETKLRAAFDPTHLTVEDESHLHAGHGGAAEHAAEFGSGPSHIHIAITAEALTPLSRLARHRAVMDVISEEVAVLHAIRMTVNA